MAPAAAEPAAGVAPGQPPGAVSRAVSPLQNESTGQAISKHSFGPKFLELKQSA